jgi:hypothetical protein
MSDQKRNMYDGFADKFRNSPVIIFYFIISCVMLFIGCWLFVEDTVSSKLGLEQVQLAYNMNVQIFGWTYWIMSLAPQVASIIFASIFFATGEKKYGVAALICQGADFLADQWYRSNGNMLNDPMVFLISGLLTFFYFSIGSELFITVGFGLTLKLFKPAVIRWRAEFGKGSFSDGNKGKNQNTREEKKISYPVYPKSDYQAKHRPGATSTSPRPIEPTYRPIGYDPNANDFEPAPPPWGPS